MRGLYREGFRDARQGRASEIARVFCAAPGRPVVPASRPPRGAERRKTRGIGATPLSCRRGRPTRLRGVSPLPCDRRRGASRRSTCGDFCSGVRASRSTLAALGAFRGAPVSPPAHAASLPSWRRSGPVQPSFWQSGLNAARSGPRTSRVQGYEACPRAPHRLKVPFGPPSPNRHGRRISAMPPSAAPSSARLRKTPLEEQDGRNIVWIRERSIVLGKYYLRAGHPRRAKARAGIQHPLRYR